MLPLHRLAAQQQNGSAFAKARSTARAFFSSRLATRILVLLAASVFLLLFLSPTYSDFRPSFTRFDDDQEPVRLPPSESHGTTPSSGSPSQWPPIDKETVALWTSRAELVKGSFIHAWNGYEKYAFGYDELLPLSNTSVTNLNGWGVTIVDSLSTMKLMGLDNIYERGMQHVRTLTFKEYVCILWFIRWVCAVY